MILLVGSIIILVKNCQKEAAWAKFSVKQLHQNIGSVCKGHARVSKLIPYSIKAYSPTAALLVLSSWNHQTCRKVTEQMS